MSQERTNESQIIRFDTNLVRRSSKPKSGPTREELVEAVRQVLSPCELFKMNAARRKGKKSNTNLPEILQFPTSTEEAHQTFNG